MERFLDILNEAFNKAEKRLEAVDKSIFAVVEEGVHYPEYIHSPEERQELNKQLTDMHDIMETLDNMIYEYNKKYNYKHKSAE